MYDDLKEQTDLIELIKSVHFHDRDIEDQWTRAKPRNMSPSANKLDDAVFSELK